MSRVEAADADGWVVASLGNIAKPSKAKVDPTEMPGAAYVGLEHVEAHTMRVLGAGMAEDVKSTKAVFKAGDVLYGKLRPYLNKVAQPDFDGIASTDFFVFSAEELGVDASYFAYYLNQQWVAEEAHHLSSGVELPRVDWTKFRSLPFTYPRDREQQVAVVGRIRSALATLAGAAAGVEATDSKLDALKQALMAAACRGRLTEQWRVTAPEHPTAQDFLDGLAARSALRVRRRGVVLNTDGLDELPDGWTWTTIGALVEVATGATPLRKRADYYGGKVPWVTSGAVNAGRITEASEFVTDRALRETNAKLFPVGTLLVAMYGEGQTRGRVAKLAIQAATNQAVAALLFDEQTEVLRPYLRLFLEQNYLAARRMSFGGVQANLSLGVIKAMPVPLPPLEEQRAIMARVAEVLKLSERVETYLGEAATALAGSAQAVLAAEFRRELALEAWTA